MSRWPMTGPYSLPRLIGGSALYFLPHDEREPELPRMPDSRHAALVGLIITLLLVLGGVLLVHVLGRAAKLQDCVMSGRTNCAPITSPAAPGGG
ncbi:MAG: hypothetical protein ACREU3_11970 [Steroidobacteraceae bacterium]